MPGWQCGAAFCSCHRRLSTALRQKVRTRPCMLHPCSANLHAHANCIRDRGRYSISVGPRATRPAGLEGAKGTAWESLAASEKIAVACAFIQEEDGLLALKFLARVMASFGGS